MKKRVRILISLLMISGSLTLTSKSYAEPESAVIRALVSNEAGAAYCGLAILGTAGLLNLAQKGGSMLTANRFYKIGEKGVRTVKSALGSLALITWPGCAGVALGILFNMARAEASEIVENPALSMENENFRFLTEVVGTEFAFSSVKQIANGEDPEIVVNSLASLLEQNSNAEDGFLDSGNEEDIEAQ